MYAPMDWGGRVEAGFPNTAIYPPVFYLPAAAALAAARIMNLSVLHGLILARLAGGAAAIIAGTVAIALAEDAALWIFAILLLPMSLGLTASLSQDALMLAATALAVVVCRRATMPRELIAAALLFALVAMARPPYAAFALLLLRAPLPLGHRWAAVLFVAAATVCWGLLAAPRMQFSHGGIDPAAQLRHLMIAPWQIPVLLAATWQTSHLGLLIGFIGSLGWQDVNLPGWYDRVACMVLAVALLSFLAGVQWRDRAVLLVPAAILAACGLVALVEYLTWSDVAAPRIEGLQGRYFLAPALLVAALPVAGRRKLPWIGVAETVAWLFPVLSIAVVINAIRVRYYV